MYNAFQDSSYHYLAKHLPLIIIGLVVLYES